MCTIASAEACKKASTCTSGEPYRVLSAFDPRSVAILLLGSNKVGDERWSAPFLLAFVGEARHLLNMLDFRITLEARNPARGCLRHYRVEAGTDLFGTWVVQISYGRIGTAGRTRSYVVRDEAQARRLTQSILNRRATAPRRIGVAYRILELIDPAGWAGSYGSVGTAENDACR
jgi:hypothetical protein